MTGEQVDARQALRIGLIQKIVPAAELLGEAHALADRIAAFPRQALAAVKRLAASDVPDEEEVARSIAELTILHGDPEGAEARRRFTANRKQRR